MSDRRDRFVNFLLRSPQSLASRARVARLRLAGATIGRRCRLAAVEVPRNPWDIELRDGVALDRGVTLLSTGSRTDAPRIVIGAGCYVNRHTMFDASERLEVGAGCMIGPFCYLTDHNHGTDAGAAVAFQPLLSAPTVLGEDVWLGAGVSVLKGVRIGDGAVVGAGAVVTRDLPAGSISRGVPARPGAARGACS